MGLGCGSPRQKMQLDWRVGLHVINPLINVFEIIFGQEHARRRRLAAFAVLDELHGCETVVCSPSLLVSFGNK